MSKKNKGGRPRIFKTVEELEKKINGYKKYLKDNEKPPTIAGLAYHLGVDRQTIYNYKEKDEFFGTIKSFVDWIIMNYEEIAIQHPSGGIVFLMKNYGYTDKQEIESININQNINEEVLSAEERKARIKELTEKNSR